MIFESKANEMVMSQLEQCTPHYVLMHKNSCIGPGVALLRSGIECWSIYGFSERGLYDQFCLKSEQALTPYPLVKRYLQNQVDSPGSCLKLVVIDAAGPHEQNLQAITIEAALEAHENNTKQVTAGYHLAFDQHANIYRVEETP